MKRALLFAAALIAAGCGATSLDFSVSRAKKEDAAKKAVESAEAKNAARPIEYFQVDATSAGAVSGKVTFRGARPARQAISMDAEQGCQQANDGKPVYDPAALVGKNAGLANAFVYIRAGFENKKFEPVKDPVVLDQHGCMFLPRVIGIRAGQTLDLKNGDSVAHNIHPIPANNREWNQEQPPHAADVEHRFPRPEVMIPVKCNIHAWMHAWIGVVDHPYFAVTGPDGAFEWKSVPRGDYTLSVWHEQFGTQDLQIHIATAATTAVNFTYPLTSVPTPASVPKEIPK